MTAPLGSIGGYSRPLAPVVVPPAPGRVVPLPEPAAGVYSSAVQSSLRVTPDHLALIRALIEAGQTTRAMELLNAVWHPQLADEHSWYLRLWILAEEGRLLEAMELARVASSRLPGSSAVAYLQAALEHAAGSPGAVEAAVRAGTSAPERSEPRALLAALLTAAGAEAKEAGDNPRVPQPAAERLPLATTDGIPNPVAAAVLGAALLHPLGSERPHRPAVSAHRREPPAPAPARATVPGRRFGLIAAATVIAALWAIRDPLPAAALLAAIVLWLARPAAASRSAAGS